MVFLQCKTCCKFASVIAASASEHVVWVIRCVRRMEMTTTEEKWAGRQVMGGMRQSDTASSPSLPTAPRAALYHPTSNWPTHCLVFTREISQAPVVFSKYHKFTTSNIPHQPSYIRQAMTWKTSYFCSTDSNTFLRLRGETAYQ